MDQHQANLLISIERRSEADRRVTDEQSARLIQSVGAAIRRRVRPARHVTLGVVDGVEAR